MRRRLIVLFVASVVAGFGLYETNADERTGNKAANLSFYYADNLPPRFFDLYSGAIEKMTSEELNKLKRARMVRDSLRIEARNVQKKVPIDASEDTFKDSDVEDVIYKFYKEHPPAGITPEDARDGFCEAMALLDARDVFFNSVGKTEEEILGPSDSDSQAEELSFMSLNIKELINKVGNMIVKSNEDIRYFQSKLDDKDVYEIWFGMAKIPNPERNTYQYGQVGLVKGERF